MTPEQQTRQCIDLLLAQAGRSVQDYATFRATGITNYLVNGGTLEKAQQLANHESARTTKLYVRRDDKLNLVVVERITI